MVQTTNSFGEITPYLIAPRFGFYIAGVAGPFVDSRFYGRYVQGIENGNPYYAQYAGIKANAGVEAKILSFGLSYSVTLFDFENELVKQYLGSAPNIPILSSPANGATNVSLPPTLIWNESSGADSYTLQVSTSSSLTSFVYNQSGLTGTSQQISGLNNSTKYHWRVSATNSYGTSGWSSVWNFTTESGGGGGEPCPGIPTVTYEGKTYNTVLIGNQCWLKENLDIGTMITGSQNQTNNGFIEKYCYDNDPLNCEMYGGLYEWDEAMQYVTNEGAQGICPPGWQIPTETIFVTLRSEVGGNGNALKEIGQGSGGGAGTNTSGFSALLAGGRFSSGEFAYLDSYAYFWSSTLIDEAFGRILFLSYDDSNIFLNLDRYHQYIGLSVRCFKPAVGTVPLSPSLSSPLNGAKYINVPTTLSWSISIGANSYTLQVSENSNFTSFVYNQGGLTGTSQQVSGLDNSTTYYWRVRARNSNGVSEWSWVWNFTTLPEGSGEPCPSIPTVTYEGKVYNTVQIGNQCWLKENLDVGTRIDGSQDQTNNGSIEKYCYGDNCETYGGLYQWNEAMEYNTTPGSQGICPPGWHIPTYTEYATLKTEIGDNGNALKEIGQGTGRGAGTNTSGFSALLAGKYYGSGNFGGLGNFTVFWSSTESNTTKAYDMFLDDNTTYVWLYTDDKIQGLSIRCLKD